MRNNIYALYKNDELLVIGTTKEIAKFRNVKVETIRFYRTPTYKKRCGNSKNRLELVLVDENDE